MPYDAVGRLMSLIQRANPYVNKHIHSIQSHDALHPVYMIQCHTSFINIPSSQTRRQPKTPMPHACEPCRPKTQCTNQSTSQRLSNAVVTSSAELLEWCCRFHCSTLKHRICPLEESLHKAHQRQKNALNNGRHMPSQEQT